MCGMTDNAQNQAIWDEMQRHVYDRDSLLTEISLPAAEALAVAHEHGIDVLILDAVTQMDAPVAQALAGYQGEQLMLNGLTEISADVARSLGQARCQILSLRGLKGLPADAAYGLASFKGSQIMLNGIEQLSNAAIEAFAVYSGTVLLEGSRTLSR